MISTANYPARKFGVRSAMPTGMALKLCPHLTLLPGGALTPTKKPQIISAKFSRAIPRALNRYHWMKPISMSPIASIATVLRPSSPREIRQTIFNELQLTASAGVAPVKFLAKIASDMNKPNGQFVITPAEVPAFLQTLPLAKNSRRRQSLGGKTGSDGAADLR